MLLIFFTQKSELSSISPTVTVVALLYYIRMGVSEEFRDA